MCGIFLAIQNPKNKDRHLDTNLLSSLCNEYIRGRGPTYQESFASSNIYAYQSVLAIQTQTDFKYSHDYSLGSEQFVLYNGEIYDKNTFSDTAQIHNAVSRKDLDRHLNNSDGMYVVAHAYIDNGNWNVNIYRDCVGEKHCWYFKDENIFMMSSVPGVIAKYIKRKTGKLEYNYEVLLDYLFRRHLISPSLHPIKGINQIPTCNSSFSSADWDLSHQADSTAYNLTTYFDSGLYSLLDSLDNLDYSMYVESELAKTLELMNLSIHSGVRMGSIISGGLDSSIVTSLLLESTTNQINTYTLQIPNKDNIAKMSREMLLDCCKCTLDHHIDIECTPESYFTSLQETIKLLASPINTHSLPSSLQLADIAAKNTQVLYGGEGADELFLGYSCYIDILRGLDIESPYNALDKKYFRNINDLFQHAQVSSINSIFTKRKNTISEFFGNAGLNQRDCRIKTESFCDFFYQLQSVGLMSTDLINSSCGLESRTPFTRKDIIKLGISSPVNKLVCIEDGTAKVPILNIFLRRFGNRFLKPKLGFAGYPNESKQHLGPPEQWKVWDLFPSLYQFKDSFGRAEEWKIINIEWFLREWF